MYPLSTPAQNYQWGKQGLDSTVAQLLQESGDKVDSEKPYAELWIGTHVNGPAKLRNENKSLQDFLKSDPSLQCRSPLSPSEIGDLPYLFKILSVNKALSIQAHPDIPLAQKLHAKFPKIYRDDNHKPEMACAITEFEALAGFQDLEVIMKNIEEVPELKHLLNQVISESCESKLENRERLQLLFGCLMKADPIQVNEQVNNLQQRLEGLGKNISAQNELALRLCYEYPGDVGVFCVYFMCYRCLKPGEAVFLGANEPHAYLKGDCAEVMARSDNVVRAGLTPKLRDVETLCNMLTYSEPSSAGFYPPGNILAPIKRDKYTDVYAPPDPKVSEFELERTVVERNSVYRPLKSFYGSVILILNGSGTITFNSSDGGIESLDVKRGNSFFQAAESDLKIETINEELTFFRTTTKGSIR